MEQYVVDAFTDQVFSGNPAAVCILESWPDDEFMRSIARENNLSETAYAVKEGEGYRLRWFTPEGEIDLCGHATLATAYVLMQILEPEKRAVAFETMSGWLFVTKNGELLTMDLPSYELTPVPVTKEMADALGVTPKEAYLGRDLLCVLESEEAVRKAKPDLEKVACLAGDLLHITARGQEFDCVSRSFAPKCGVPEDPVCGSGHCHIFPYWAGKLGKNKLTGFQASARGGVLYGEWKGKRVEISGKAALFSKAEIFV